MVGSWRHIENPELGPLNDLSKTLARYSIARPLELPSFSNGSDLFIGVDFSGQDQASQFFVVGIYIVELTHAQEQIALLREWRQRNHRDGRRMAYKALRDRRLIQSLPEYLAIVSEIPGVLATIAIDKRDTRLLDYAPCGEATEIERKLRAAYNYSVLARSLLTINLTAVFLRGLSQPKQNIWWLLDNDEIVATPDQRSLFTGASSHIISQLVPHDMGRLRIGRTGDVDDGSRLVEDLISPSDLAAGAYCDILSRYARQESWSSSQLIAPMPSQAPKKARQIANWIAYPGKRLSTLVIRIRVDTQTNLRHTEVVNAYRAPPSVQTCI